MGTFKTDNKKKQFAFSELKKDTERKAPQNLEEFTNVSNEQKKSTMNPYGRKGNPNKKSNKKDPNKREANLLIYLTEEQKQTIMNKAKELNLSASAYVLNKALGNL